MSLRQYITHVSFVLLVLGLLTRGHVRGYVRLGKSTRIKARAAERSLLGFRKWRAYARVVSAAYTFRCRPDPETDSEYYLLDFPKYAVEKPNEFGGRPNTSADIALDVVRSFFCSISFA